MQAKSAIVGEGPRASRRPRAPVVRALARMTLAAAAVLAVAAGPGLACGEKKGGLMLAVTTDMLAPKDVNVVSVSIQVGPQIKYNFIGRVTPEGEVLLPATLAIIEPDDPNAAIRVRVIAFKETKPRVLRDVTTTSPRAGRIALLRMPLSFVNDDSATGALPADNVPAKAASLGTRDLRPLADPFNPYGAEVVSACTDPDQTMIDGECASSMVDSSTLPDYSDDLVFPGGDRSKCFTTATCFTGWREVVDVDLDACTAPKGGDVTNVALLTTDTGACRPSGECFVPIDRSDEGWRDEGDRVRLPKGVCKKLRQGAKLGVVGGAACAQKTPDLPVCTNGETAFPDAGKGDSGADGGPSGAERVLEAGGVSGLAVLDGRVFFGSNSGLFELSGGKVEALPFSPATPRIAPWLLAQHGDNVVFLDGEVVAAFGELTPTIFPNGGATKVVTYEPANTILPRSAAIGPQAAWVAFKDDSGGGNVLAIDFGISSPATTGFASSTIRATAVGYAQNDSLWVGDETGKITLCATTFSPFSCPAPVQLDPSGPAIDGIGTAPAPIDQAFLLRPDGLFLATREATAPIQTKRLTTDDLAGVDDGAYFPRGIAANAKCAFYASKRGLEYMSADGTGFGVLADETRAQVLDVALPVLPGTTERYVYFAVRDSIPAGGGVYRVRVPASCL
ncbi:MAG: hypothetical protein KF764_08840 [Labilithrix sp.]|nr:hypothetical protein [Labilithrix sp.]